MKHILAVFLFLLFVCFNTYAQTGRLRQVKSGPVIQRPASARAIATFVAFFEYVKKYKPNIVEDTKAQERWLTKSLRQEMMEANAAWVKYLKKNPDDKPTGLTMPHLQVFGIDLRLIR